MRKIFPLILIFSFIANPAEAARLWSCGFELQSVASSVEWDTTTGVPALDTTNERTGAAAFICAATGRYMTHALYSSASSQTLYARFYMRINTLASGADADIFMVLSSTTERIKLTLTTGNVLKTTTNSVTNTGATALTTGVYYRIEVMWNGTSGAYEVLIDGTSELSGTSDIATKTFTSIRLGAISSSTFSASFDDLGFNDTTGSYQTTWPGSGRIVHLIPNGTGDGSSGGRSQPTTGQPTDDQVDEVPSDDASSYWEFINDADYIHLALEDSSTYSIGSTDTIAFVAAGMRSRGETTNPAGGYCGIKSQASGTIVNGTDVSVANNAWYTHDDASVKVYNLTQYVDPQAGGSWTSALLDSSQIRVYCSDGAPNWHVTIVWALVEYRPSNIKKISNVELANVKKVSNVTRANVKKVSSVSN